jgi:hypothetical protein
LDEEPSHLPGREPKRDQKTLLSQTNFEAIVPQALRSQAKLAVKGECTFGFLELADEHTFATVLISALRFYYIWWRVVYSNSVPREEAGGHVTEADALQLRDQPTVTEVQRILESGVFRNSEALRRLLRFLADKMLAGEADQLKEYTVGIDALGKPPTYDPRLDSIVRIQVGRLRQKLAEYYRTEGKEDPFIIDLPKGRFKLTCEPSPLLTANPVHAAEAEVGAVRANRVKDRAPNWRVLVLICVAIVSTVATLTLSLELWNERRATEMLRSMWTPDLEQLWKPFMTGRPLIVAIADPPFVQFKGYGAYRDLQLNHWEDIVKSPQVEAIRKALKDPEIQQSVYYAPMGEVNALFLLGKLMGPRVPGISLLRNSELSVQQLANNNVLYIGSQVFFQNQFSDLPVKLDLDNSPPGIHNRAPQRGEPEILSDTVPVGVSDDGETYVLITHAPGPLGNSEVESFTSRRTPGRLAAVQWVTDPKYAKMLVSKLRDPSGKMPRYYQVVLKVTYRAGVPTQTSYVFHHEIRTAGDTGKQ